SFGGVFHIGWIKALHRVGALAVTARSATHPRTVEFDLRAWPCLQAGALDRGDPGQSQSSAPIVPIDRDILFGEVAGPHATGALAEAKAHSDDDLVVLHVGRRRGLRVLRIALAPDRDPCVAEPDGELVPVRRLPGLANRHHDASPI